MLFPERESERGGGGGGEMASRLPTWKERENNKRRERRRRAISSKIYAGLRMYGGYKLPKHCDNNEVLKALCAEAGWIVEPDGTTYRKGCKPAEPKSVTMGSVSPSPYSSYQPSPCSSYNPSPTSSSFPSPTRAAASSYMAEANIDINYGDLKNRSMTYKLSHPHHPYARNGFSVSAPVTPPLSSPTARTPRINPSWGPLSSPPSPGRQVTVPDPGWLSGFQIPNGGPLSPTFSLVSSNPFAYFKPADDSSRLCSPIGFRVSDASDEFAFGSNSGSNHDGDGPQGGGGLVKPWEGERIHEECCGPDDHLELTLAL